MLFINHTTSSTNAKKYFTEHLCRSDYYMRDAQEVVGKWHGRGAELLGLEGEVDKERYFKLCDNIDPNTGKPLTVRTRGDRRVLYDFTFNAPKSVTLAYELGGDDRVLAAQREAVEQTMSAMEDAMQTRVRKNGSRESRPTSNLIWGDFTHRTTRPVDGIPDPSLHIHAVAINATFDPVEDRWKAGEFEKLVRDKGFYQAVYHSHLSRNLAALGYGIERDGNSFRLAGIDRETCEIFSRRSKIIEEEAIRRGINTPRGKRDLGRQTREAKPEQQMTMAQLRAEWSSHITKGQQKAIAAARSGQQTQTLTADQAIAFAVSHSFERNSVVTEKNLLRTALIQSFGKASVADVEAAAAKREDIQGNDRKGQRYVTTREVLREERQISDFVRSGKGACPKLGGYGTLRPDAALSPEQQEARRSILDSRARVMALKGGAGTGKTRMLRSTVAAIEKNGTQVFTFAPSAEASHGVLRSEGFTNADTVERLLIDKEMQKKVKDQLVLIDEAGLLSVKDMKRLFDVAKEQNARVLLSGDSDQHHGVTRGDALRILERDAGLEYASLRQIRRQTNETYRSAIASIAQGDAIGKDGRTGLEAGIDTLDRMGAIIEAEGEARYRQIAGDYAQVTSERKKDGTFKTALVVAPTHAEIRHVSAAIRETLKAQGKLAAKDREFTVLTARNLTEAERTIASNYAQGEVVQFHQNAKGFKRGERVTVTGQAASEVTVARADGRKTLLPLQEAKKFQLYRTEKLGLAKGDKLRITQNGFTETSRRGLSGAKVKDRLNNGALYEVEGFDRQGDIKLTNGFIIPKHYGGLTHGYVVTSHASQGKTVDVPLVALGSESFAAANREQFYVSLSRGREAVRLYTDDKTAMLEAVQASSARLSATELMRDAPPAPKRKPGVAMRLYGQAHRAYQKLKERIAAHDLVKAYRAQQHRREELGHGRH